jgi:hypothetical protein
MKIPLLILYLIFNITVDIYTIYEKWKKDKTKSMKLYNINIFRYTCMWNESNGKLLKLTKNGRECNDHKCVKRLPCHYCRGLLKKNL